MLSSVKEAGLVTYFPKFTGERVYMQEFWAELRLPEPLRRWQSTVDQMLVGIETGRPMFLMIDQSIVEAGQAQRRPGIHVDGYWDKGVSMHNGNAPGHTPLPPAPSHSPQPGGSHTPRAMAWEDSLFVEPEAIILASNISASRGFVGEFDGPIHDGGDASEVDLSALSVIELESHRTYVGNVSFLHQSLPVPEACQRTLVRINAPGWA